MIPQADILAWRAEHPWVTNAQVEQDLITSRAVVDLFAHPALEGRLAMRGGTAMHKLYMAPATRYSEDIDLVQTQAGPIGDVLNEMRTVLDPWLGGPSSERKENGVKLTYRFESEIAPVARLRLKIEINTREHVAMAGHVSRHHEVLSRWFSGAAAVRTFSLNELLGTKMRALYQRRKGRDLYDLWLALSSGLADPVSGDVHILVEKERFNPKELDWDVQSPSTHPEGTSYAQRYRRTEEYQQAGSRVVLPATTPRPTRNRD